jgi:hypothetical protein
MQVSPMERRPAGHRSHREHLHPGSLVAEIDPGFIPVDLSFLGPAVTLRHKRLPPQQTQLAAALAHMVAHRRLRDRDVREFRQNAAIETSRRVPLFARRLTIRRQNTINERRDLAQLRLAAFWVVVLRRQRSGQRLAHNPPVNTELRGNSRYRPDTKFMLSTKLLEQIHFGSPVHARPPDLLGRP